MSPRSEYWISMLAFGIALGLGIALLVDDSVHAELKMIYRNLTRTDR